MFKIFRLLWTVLLCESAGLIGTVFTINSVNSWYLTLEKPFFNPPNWVFGPVWTILYFLMGISLFLVWGKKKVDFKWFWIQLILNTTWSIVFFGLKSPELGFLIILLLLITIFKTIKEFGKTNKSSARLLYPYLIWVSFATVLNLSIILLNW